MIFFAVLCFIQLILTGSSSLEGNRTRLNILGLLPYYQRSPSWTIGYRIIPAVQIAVDDVNKDPSILPDYNLTMIMENGGCDQRTIAAKAVGTALLSENIVGIVGAPCTASTIVMSNIVNNAGINQVSYGSELADVSDTTLYPYFFRTTISLAHAADGFSRLLEYFNRRSIIVVSQIGTWEQVGSFFTSKYTFYKNYNNTVAHTSLLSSDDTDGSIDSKLETVRTFNRHVIVTFLTPGIASALMCRAYNLGMTSPNYLWIHHLTTGEWEWWLNRDYFKGCSKDEMQLAHQGSMIHRLSLNTTNETRYGEFTNEYTTRLAAYLTELNIPYNSLGNCTDQSLPCLSSIVHVDYSRIAYDAVWVLAKALHRAEEKLKQKYNQTLGDFQRGINHFSELIHDSLRDTKFPGLSGDIEYRHGGNVTLDKNTRAIKSAFFEIQFADNVAVSVAEYDATRSKDDQLNTSTSLISINQSIPEDIEMEYARLFSKEAGYTFLVFNILFLIITVTILILNNLYFNHQPFKGSDGTLTNFQIGAVYLLTVGSLITSVFSCVDIDNATAFGVAANSSTWLTDVGLIFFLAIAVGKSYRFYSIFVNFNQKPRFLNVYFILAFAFFAMGVTIIYEFVIVISSPFLRSSSRYHDLSTVSRYYYVEPRYTSYVVIVAATMMSIFLFILGIQGWSIKDPRFYDIHTNAMLSVGFLFYCLLVAVTIPTLPRLSWPFMHCLSTTFLCGAFIQFFFVRRLLWKFFVFHRDSARIKCHCMLQAQGVHDSNIAKRRNVLHHNDVYKAL